MTAPQPIPAVLCDTCSLPWDDHLKSASRRTSRLYDEDEREVECPDEPVSLLDCLQLTKQTQRGPVGWPGASGPQGPQGSDGKQGPAGPFGGSA